MCSNLIRRDVNYELSGLSPPQEEFRHPHTDGIHLQTNAMEWGSHNHPLLNKDNKSAVSVCANYSLVVTGITMMRTVVQFHVEYTPVLHVNWIASTCDCAGVLSK